MDVRSSFGRQGGAVHYNDTARLKAFRVRSWRLSPSGRLNFSPACQACENRGSGTADSGMETPHMKSCSPSDTDSNRPSVALPAHEHDAWRLCVAPMIDVTDRHCRYFHRLLAPKARLYTEMITTGALMHGDVPRHLDFDPSEHPLALQLGGSEPRALA